jgi:hypothetical protein
MSTGVASSSFHPTISRRAVTKDDLSLGGSQSGFVPLQPSLPKALQQLQWIAGAVGSTVVELHQESFQKNLISPVSIS